MSLYVKAKDGKSFVELKGEALERVTRGLLVRELRFQARLAETTLRGIAGWVANVAAHRTEPTDVLFARVDHMPKDALLSDQADKLRDAVAAFKNTAAKVPDEDKKNDV